MKGILWPKLRIIARLLPLLAIVPVAGLLIVEFSDRDAQSRYAEDQVHNISMALKNDISWIDFTSPKESAKELETLIARQPYILGTEVVYNDGITSRFGNFGHGKTSTITINGENVKSVTFNFATPPKALLTTYLSYATAGSLFVLLILGSTSLLKLQRSLRKTQTALRASERHNMQMIEASERDRAYRWISLQTIIDVVRPGLFNANLLLEMLEKINTHSPLYQHPDTFYPGLIVDRVVEGLEPHLGEITNLGCTNDKDLHGLIAYTYPSYFGNIVSILLSVARSIGNGKITVEYSFHIDANGVGNLITRVCNCSVGIPKSRLFVLKNIFEGSIDAISTSNIEYLVAHRCAQIMDGRIYLNSNSRDWTEFTVQVPISTSSDPLLPPATIFNTALQATPVARVLIIGECNKYIINQLEILGIHAGYAEALDIPQYDLRHFDIILVNKPTRTENRFLNEYFTANPDYSLANRQFQLICTGNIDTSEISYTSHDNVLGTCLEAKIIELIYSHLKIHDQILKIAQESTSLQRF